jgi:octaprenyl-diphosphate synthase
MLPGLSSQVPPEVQAALAAGLERVAERFERQLRSDLPPVSRLVGHLEGYRGKMLRPMLVLACGLAAGAAGRGEGGGGAKSGLGEDHITAAAVCEMIHMATLVHDDVLDEAETRRRGTTVNRLHGNEAAVILGDYLIAAAYHLCSQMGSAGVSLRVAETSMTICSGELLQLSRREDFSLDEATYEEIIDRKTGALVALSCRLGAECSGAGEGERGRFERFGRLIGRAFQIQDDVLDLTGRAAALGKPVGQDLAKGKLTLPVIHHLASVEAMERGKSLLLIERATGGGPDASDAAAVLVRELERSGSLEHARRVARGLVERAKGELSGTSLAEASLRAMADAVVEREG